MIYIAYFILFFSVLQLLIAIVNLLFNSQFAKTKTKFSGLVSILIPARNEEENIGNLLNDLLQQEYKNIEIIVFNDISTDNTAEIVLEHSKHDNRIKLINSESLPVGWLGKNYACHTLSNHAKGEYFLFIDADVRVNNNIILNTIEYSQKYKLGLLSIFPKQIMKSFGEFITVPNMNYILLSLLPLILVRKSKATSIAAANGQFMLFNSAIYHNTLPHEKMKLNKVEDIEIARYYKQNNIQIACLTGDDSVACRMYGDFNNALNGFSKNVFAFFGNSYVVAILFWLITSLGFLSIYLSLPIKQFEFYWFIIVITRIFISIASKQNIFTNIIFLIPQQFALGLIIYKALCNKFKKQFQWKGRNIS